MENLEKDKVRISEEILNQLGGKKFIAMTSATCYYYNNTFTCKFKGSKIANIMYVTLMENDLYNVKICKFRDTEVKTIKELNNVYSDMLKPIFEETTGLIIIL